MLQDYKLGIRMLVKYPGLTLAGALALAIAIGVGAGYYELIGKVLAPAIPLPEGNRVVLIETQNILTNTRVGVLQECGAYSQLTRADRTWYVAALAEPAWSGPGRDPGRGPAG